ncbi:MAG: diacylglycerol kinase family lipid kinase [Ignavibacterium sp.]|jgi:YegS/Rv2252/BmrU family lipid kinase|nr:diacylglycerol kinase family lipid kinase [Ignavibacterium sp.]
MSNKKIQIIFNPASAGGRTKQEKEKLLHQIKFYFGDGYIFSETTSESNATSFVQKAIENGSETIVAVGGDGTLNQVINGFFHNGIYINPDVALGVIGFGTGQGFAQSLGLPADLSSQVKLIKENPTKSIDIGKIHFNDNYLPKYFLNEFQVGIGGSINKTISPKTKKILRKFAFGFEAVKTLFSYEADELQILINGKTINEKIIGVVIANGEFTGGGMRLTPNALLDDGLFDVLVIKDMPLSQRYISFSKIYSGKHIDLDAFELHKVKNIEFNYQDGVLLSSDGELINSKCVGIEVLHSVLNVISNN